MNNYISQKTTDYHVSLIQSLHDKNKATAYLEVAIEEYEDVVEAQGGIGHLSKKLD